VTKILFISPDIIQGSFINEYTGDLDIRCVTYERVHYIDDSKLLILAKSIDPLASLSKKYGLQIGGTRFYLGLKKILKKEKPDVVVILDFYRAYFWQALYFKKRGLFPSLVLCSETKLFPASDVGKLLLRIFLFVLRRFQKDVAKIVTYTEKGKNFLQPKFPRIPFEVRPPGIKPEFFASVPKKKTGKCIKFLIVARMVSFKRYFDLFAAFKKLVESGAHVHLSIVGNGPLESSVRTKIIDWNLEKYVTFLEGVEHTEMSTYYTTHDVLVLPSFNEAIGMVVLEAMSCGLPTLTSDTVGASDYVINKKTGCIFKSKDVNDLFSKMKFMCSRKILDNMSVRSRKHSLRFTLEKRTAAYFDSLDV
jgi:glycosyltransferase involved in cell wall biosynthesis